MDWLPLLRLATGVNMTAGAHVTMSKTRKNNRNRAARSTSECGQVNVAFNADICGKLLASSSTKASHADSVSQSPSEANILPDITGGKRKHVNGVEGSGGNDQKGCRRIAGTDLSKTSCSLEFDGISFLPSVAGTLLVTKWRPNAREDLPVLARRFGADLSSVPEEWLDMEKAAALLQKHGLRLPVAGGKLRDFRPGERIMFWEVYSGCGNATRAFLESATGDHEIAGPPVDTLRKAWPGLPSWNVLLPSVRQFLWAIMVVCQPMWVHCGPPCTFWSSLPRRTNHGINDEDFRLQVLVHIVFSVQVCYHQMRQNTGSASSAPSCSQLEIGFGARVGGLWHHSDWADGGGLWHQSAWTYDQGGEVHLR